MLRLLALILALFVFGCAGHDAGSAVEVTAASEACTSAVMADSRCNRSFLRKRAWLSPLT